MSLKPKISVFGYRPCSKTFDAVYCIKTTEFLKVGVTRNLENRLTQYRTHNPIFILLGYVKFSQSKTSLGGSCRPSDMFEGLVHDKFSSLCFRDEWFHYSDEIVEYILGQKWDMARLTKELQGQ